MEYEVKYTEVFEDWQRDKSSQVKDIPRAHQMLKELQEYL